MRSAITRFIRLAVIIGVASVVFALTNPAGAVAQPIKLRSCFQGAVGVAESAIGWLPLAGQMPLHPVRACPRELGFDTDATVRQGTNLSLEFSVGQLNTSSVSLTIASGETVAGMAYELLSCSLGVCTTLRRIERRTASDGADTLTIPFAGAWLSLRVRAICETAFCDAGRGLRFNNVEFEVIDPDPPIVTASWSPGFWWVRPGDVYVSLFARDQGVGLGHVSAVVDDRAVSSPFWEVSGCDMTAEPEIILPIAWGCAVSDTQRFNSLLDTRKLADGKHTITVAARDAAGNQAVPAVTTFQIDGTAPAAPDSVVVEALNADGWTSADQSKIFWKNGGEVRPTEVSSGLGRGFIDFEARSGQSEDPPPSSFGPAGPNGDWMGPTTFPGDGRWDMFLWLEDSAGNPSPKAKVPVGRDTDIPAPPQLDAVPWLNRADVVSGRNLSGVQPVGSEIESGICGYAAAFNATGNSTPSPALTNRWPISSVRIPADLPAGDSFAHLRAMSCSGLASSVATVPLRLDDRPPSVESDGGAQGGWSRRPLDLTLSAIDDRSGVAGIRRQLDGGAIVSSDGDLAEFALGEGRNRLRFWAADRAGNESPAELREYNVDLTPPHGSFDVLDRSRPADVSAIVSDSLSGVDSAQIQYRRIDVTSDVWHGLPTAATVDPGGPTSLRLAAHVPDTQLADGIYALRVLAADRAGNVAAFDVTNASDGPLRLTLPLRERWVVQAATMLRASHACTTKQRRVRRTGCKRRVSGIDAKSTRMVNFRDAVTLTGDLRDAAGEPRPGKTLKVYSAVKGFAPELIADVTTGADGRYNLKLTRGPTRRLSVIYEGDDRTLSVKANADLRVRSAATLSVRPTVTTVGRTVRISGRLASGDEWLPDVGKLIELQFKNGTVWQPGIGSIWTLPGENGRFGTTYTFHSSRKSATLIRVRALVRHEGAWPFEDGASNEVVLTLRP